ncbi:hypothetical protein HNR46_001635 [Haloferula luteola]|uniref:Uncharacterized protein n=1 Tax=Haloferula luteola TaxID=595692 RepID=A0A840VC63_9BACT|nr:hypothetical protein [Haloferula luteola]MBB5351399.1 hypothetical protein [Haloferula luteola]
MKRLLHLLTLSSILLGAATTAEAHGNSRSHRYVSHRTSCGCPVYAERYVAFYDSCGHPVFRTRRIPVAHQCRPVCPPPRPHRIEYQQPNRSRTVVRVSHNTRLPIPVPVPVPVPPWHR